MADWNPAYPAQPPHRKPKVLFLAGVCHQSSLSLPLCGRKEKIFSSFPW